MQTYAALLLSLSVLGAFAKPQFNTFQSNDFSGAYSSTLPVINTHIQTPVVQNPTVEFPSFIPPTTISESCHYLKTLVKPQIHNEIITVPSVNPIIRIVPSSTVENTHTNGRSEQDIYTQGDMLSAVVAGQNLTENSNKQNNSSGGNNGISGQRVFLTNQNSEAGNELNIGLFARPTFFTVQHSAGSSPTVITGNSVLSHNAQSNSFQDSVGAHK